MNRTPRSGVLFPDFLLTARADWIGVWEGPLKPASKTYTVRIVYFPRTRFDGWRLGNKYVTVHVVDPLIGAEMLTSEKLLPHIYWNERDPARSALRLWDPAEMFWTPEMPIATTIIPWTSEWLLFFEYWQISGEFLGPGRHPPRRQNVSRNHPRLQTRRPALEGSNSATTNSTGLAERPAFSDPISRRWRHLELFPATVLAELEQRYLGGGSIAGYFDLVAGTSTGGIIALGRGAGLTASEMADLYLTRGAEVFPQPSNTTWGRIQSWWREKRSYVLYSYERERLEALLADALGDKLLGDFMVRPCIPAFEGKHSDVFIFKTPHHRDYKFDRLEPMIKVALATAAAPTYFRPLEHNGYTLVDGGVWANNPVMLAVIEALICFDLDRAQIDVLSLGCGDDRYVVSPLQSALGGKLTWYDVIFAAMRLQSLAATNQARLLLGPPTTYGASIHPRTPRPIMLDDFRRSRDELVPAARKAVDEHEEALAAAFLGSRAHPYEPVPLPAA